MNEVTDQELAQAYAAAETPDPVDNEPSPEAPASAAEPEAPPITGEEQPRTPVSLKDDDLVEVKIDGKTVQMSWREIAQTKAMLPGAFTKKTQELAEQRRQVEAERQQIEGYRQQAWQQAQAAQARVQQMEQYLQDPQKLAALYLAAQAGGQNLANGQVAPPQPQPMSFDPNQFRQQILGEAQQFVQQQLAAQAAASQEAAAKAALEQDFSTHTSKLLEQQPILQAMEGIDELIYGQVIKMHPSTVEEAKQFAANVVDAYGEKVKAQLQTAQKVAAVSAAKATNGIAPKGSAIPVTPQAKQYNKKKGLNDPELDKDVEAFIRSMGD